MIRNNSPNNLQNTLRKQKAFSVSSPKKTEFGARSFGQQNSRSKFQEHKNLQSQSTDNNRSNKSLNVSRSKTQNEDFQAYLDSVIKQMTQKKSKLDNCIKFFNLMQSHNAQLRCLEHSNILTIYCQTQRRALCANCVYGLTRHRTHKLIPLKDAQSYITQDNSLLWTIIESDLKNMDESIKNTQDNTVTLEKELKYRLRDIDEEYGQKVDELKAKYANKKRLMQSLLEGLVEKSRNIEKNIQEFKFKVWETLSKVGIGKRSEGSNSDIQVSRQVLCVNMSEITKVSIRKMTAKDLQRIYQKVTKN